MQTTKTTKYFGEVSQTESTAEELKQNIPELADAEGKYICYEGYVYYVIKGQKEGGYVQTKLKRVRCDGKKMITLYRKSEYVGMSLIEAYTLSIDSVSDDYVYFTETDTDVNSALNYETMVTTIKRTFCKINIDGSEEKILLDSEEEKQS